MLMHVHVLADHCCKVVHAFNTSLYDAHKMFSGYQMGFLSEGNFFFSKLREGGGVI